MLHFAHALVFDDIGSDLVRDRLLGLGRGPPRASLDGEHQQRQTRRSHPHALGGREVAADRDVPLLDAQAAVVDEGWGAEEAGHEEFPARGEVVGAVEGEEAVGEGGPQDAVEDAAADGGAEGAAEAAEGAHEAGGDVLGPPGAEVQEVGEGVVEEGAGDEAVAEDGGDEARDGGAAARGHGGEGVERQGGEDEGGEARAVEGAAAADVEGADDEAADGEAQVGRDEDGAGARGGQAVDGEHEDRGVEEDGPAGGHDADLGEAGE